MKPTTIILCLLAFIMAVAATIIYSSTRPEPSVNALKVKHDNISMVIRYANAKAYSVGDTIVIPLSGWENDEVKDTKVSVEQLVILDEELIDDEQIVKQAGL